MKVRVYIGDTQLPDSVVAQMGGARYQVTPGADSDGIRTLKRENNELSVVRLSMPIGANLELWEQFKNPKPREITLVFIDEGDDGQQPKEVRSVTFPKAVPQEYEPDSGGGLDSITFVTDKMIKVEKL